MSDPSVPAAPDFLSQDVLDVLNQPSPDDVAHGALSNDVLKLLNDERTSAAAQPAAPPTTDEQRSRAAYGPQGGISDVLGSVLDAPIKGLIKLIGLPAALVALERHANDMHGQLKASEQPAGAGDSGSPSVLGSLLPTEQGMRSTFERAAGQPLYEPQSTIAKYAAAPVEGAASMPFAPVMGAVSGAAGEAGANLLGPYGRLIGSLVGAGGVGAAKILMSSPEKLVGAVLSNASEEQLAKAQTLMDQAQAAGTPITGAEALGQVIGPNKLNAIQRVIEETKAGATTLQPMMAARPAANEAAMGRTLGTISPPVTQPAEIAPRVQAAAQGAVDTTRNAINDTTQAAYARAASATVTPQDFAALQGNAVFQDALKQVRSDPVYGALKDMPDNSVAVLDAVQKKMGRIADTMAASGDRTGAGAYLKAKDDVQEAAKAASPDYAMALNSQAAMREGTLDPLTRSPVGQLAEAKGFTQQAKIIFDPNPLPGSERAVRMAVEAVAARDPEAAQQFVRARLEQAFNESTQALATGPNQFGGAGYAATIFGNAQQAKNLQAAIRALPGGEPADAAFVNLMHIFQAQGTRLRAGSQTAFNTEALAELGKGGSIGEVFRQAGQPGSAAKNLYTSVQANMNASRLAQILTDPKSVDLMNRIAKIDPHSNAARAFMGLLVAGDQPETQTQQ